MKMGNIEPTKCRVMSSKMAPLWLCFDTIRPAGQQYQVLFKCGDDLRQDQLVLQSISLFDRIWKKSNLDLCLIPYGCIATGLEVGFIEVVPNATTIAIILSEQHGDTKLTVTDAIASSFGQSMETMFSIRKWLWEKEQKTLVGDEDGDELRRASQEVEKEQERER